MTPRFDYWHKDERIQMKNQASKEIDTRPRKKWKKNLQKLPQKYYIGCHLKVMMWFTTANARE